jgi:predicted PurR-regulated permease PerM
MIDDTSPALRSARTRQATRRYLTIAVVVLSLWITQSFLIPLAWASVLAITIWPLYSRASAGRRHRWLAPLLATAGTALLLMLPLSVAAVEAAKDGRLALAWIAKAQHTGVAPPMWLEHFPLVGGRLSNLWQTHAGTPEAARSLFSGLDAGALFSLTGVIGAQLARGSMLILVTLLALYALLRHGDRLGSHSNALAAHLLGGFGSRFTDRLITAVRGTVAGTVLVALGEGALIGIGYAAAGVPRAFLFAILTVTFAMLPFGAWVVFTVATGVLIAQGAVLAAVILFTFSVIVMLVGDNFIQPALVGNSVRLPFLLAFVGTFGGLETLGLVGLFLGPVVMATLLLVWHEAMDKPSGHQPPIPASATPERPLPSPS